ncbi:trypsin-like serine peptidase [Hyphococcus sp.]|uniref:trypsin-like serine peptidase n=1 Tax=Hyphococcus sp. TaxID=2038636 RepID=UPI003CCBFEFA
MLIIFAFAAVAVFFSIEAARYGEIKRLRERTAVLQKDITNANLKAEAALSAIIAPEAIKSAQNSVYLIVVNGSARGTAFVLDREKGILATAAHTADSLPLSDANADVRILNRRTKTPLNVKSVKLHAGYGVFRMLVEDYQPIRKNSSIYAPQATPLRDMAFDAGLIVVDPVDPETGENVLGANLDIASEETLLTLEAGAPIAVIGFPYDTLDNGFSPDAAIARTERGVIAAMTPPLDNVLENANPEIANLIIHRLATAGGSSGSPILNAQGKVIGIHTHGIESLSSNADGAAQRADLIFDLFDAKREESRIQNLFLPSWTRLLSYWARAEDVLPWSFYMEYARPGEDPAPLVRDFNFQTEPPYLKTIDRLDFEAESQSRRVEATDVAQEKIGAGDSDTTRLLEGPSFLLKEPGEYAETWRTVDRSRETVMFAFDYSLRSTSGFCPLAAYFRKKGDVRLRAMKPRASFELYLPAAGEFTEDYQIILRRRAGCDPISTQYFFGTASWTGSGAPDAIAASFSDNAVAADESGENTPALRIRQAVSAFFVCTVQRRQKDQRCQEPVYIELE